MTRGLEYHMAVRPTFSVSVAVLSALAGWLFLALPAQAQINGVPASVTSQGFGGHAVNAPRASVTSLGPEGFAPPPRVPMSAAVNGPRRGEGHRHHRQDSEFFGPVWYAVPVPYAVDSAAAEEQTDSSDDDPEYQGGPTIFDRRGSGPRSYVPPVKDAGPARMAERTEDAPAADPDPPLPPTLLVFKDGRSLEVGNYAIVGTTLFDLTPGHPRKIAIRDLDLEATRKQNDERGVIFQLPQGNQAN